MLSLEQEHQRFMQQAAWTKAIRQYVYQQVGFTLGNRVLEVGCGEGVILADLGSYSPGHVFGLDQRLEALQFSAKQSHRAYLLTNGDAYQLPYPCGCFDITLCHFTLLWLQEPLAGLKEMVRVTRPGGWVAVLAEPDYGSRIDYPEELASLGKLQAQALSQLGADPNLGRKLSGLLHQAGLKKIQTGVLGGQWTGSFTESEFEGEWNTLDADLEGILNRAEMERLRRVDLTARQNGERILFVPTFYGWGKTAR
jgi:SAM-dependent methyltransferase